MGGHSDSVTTAVSVTYVIEPRALPIETMSVIWNQNPSGGEGCTCLFVEWQPEQHSLFHLCQTIIPTE